MAELGRLVRPEPLDAASFTSRLPFFRDKVAVVIKWWHKLITPFPAAARKFVITREFESV